MLPTPRTAGDNGMINALICAYKSGDVLPLTLAQLIGAKAVTRILIADGPHLGPIKPGYKAQHPSVRKVVDRLRSRKIVYEYTDTCPTRADKNNRILKHVSEDCAWILCVDSDEVYHEQDLERLAEFLKSAEYGRYAVKTVNPYPDFQHCIKLPDDWKPRVYRWFPGAQCAPGHDRHHQYVLHEKQRQCQGQEIGGLARVPREVCVFWHLNAMRAFPRRVKPQPDGTIIWTGGKKAVRSKIYPLDISEAPKSIRALGKATLT